MSDDKLHVETPYVTGKDTSTPEEYVETEQKTIETERYGNGKPRRIITRVRIAHGKGSNWA
jgi:hypothetical protein